MDTSQENIETWKKYRNSTKSKVLDDSLEEYPEELASSSFDCEEEESFIFADDLRKSRNTSRS